jgi:hypothetical protein
VARATPDGYTVLFAFSSYVADPSLGFRLLGLLCRLEPILRGGTKTLQRACFELFTG